MDHVSALFADKDKFLSSIPSPMNDDTATSNNPAPSFHTVNPMRAVPISQNTTPVSESITPQMPEIPEIKEKNTDVNVDLMKITLYKMKDQLDIMLHLLEGKNTFPSQSNPPQGNSLPQNFTPTQHTSHEKTGTVIEGYFNGEKMISDEGEIFDIPANYASKSKLVDGDRMKLTITNTGSFLYKQIKPIEKQRIRGELVSGGTNGQWLISTLLGQFKVLTAAVTFHRGRVGDEVVLLIPASGHSDWGAIEHIIHKDL